MTTLCLIEFTHFSDERCIEVENRGKTHFGVLENVRCSKVYVVKCTFYWGLIYKDKEGKKRELAKMHLIARKTLYWGTLYQGSTVINILRTYDKGINDWLVSSGHAATVRLCRDCPATGCDCLLYCDVDLTMYSVFRSEK